MDREIYEVVSQGARYWFIFLMAMIVWRSYRWLARDRRQRRKRLRLLPDAGYVGEFVIQLDSPSLPLGTTLPIPREGVLGAVRGCDLFVPVKGVFKKHLWLRYEDGVGLRARPFGRRSFEVDGVPYSYAGNGRNGFLLTHGSVLKVGEAALRLRMFAGFESAGLWMDGPALDTNAPPPFPDAAMPEAAAGYHGSTPFQYPNVLVFPEEEAEASPMLFYPPQESIPEEYITEDGFEDEMESSDFGGDMEEDDFEDGLYEGLTGEAAPSKSHYVGLDEAERAKKLLWDRYLRGGGKQ